MQRRTLLGLSLAGLGQAALAAEPSTPTGLDGGQAFRWPVPAGWRKETIPFPLGFAPELKYRGVEELRFMPGFFDPKAPDYWSYAFAWWLEGKPAVDRASLEADLTRYYAGLCGAVGGKKFTFDPKRYRVSLAALKTPPGQPGLTFGGPAELYDPFVTGRELRIALSIRTWECTQAGRRVVLFTAAPNPSLLAAPAGADPVPDALAKCAASFHCG